MTQNIKIRPKFSISPTNAFGVKQLSINFAPSTHISSGIGERFSNLKSLWIKKQSIKFIERSDFAGLTQLEDLYLFRNQIEILPEDVFWDLNLKMLKLNKNKIKKLPLNIFKSLTKIKGINFADNMIEHLPKNLFANNLELESISAYNNPLKTIDVDFTNLRSLEDLGLHNANCIDFYAQSRMKVQEAQRLINRNCMRQ